MKRFAIFLIALLLSLSAFAQDSLNVTCLSRTLTDHWTNVHGVAAQGNYAYVAADAYGLHIVDISDPVSLVEVGSYDTPECANRVTLSGSYAYVADGGQRPADH